MDYLRFLFKIITFSFSVFATSQGLDADITMEKKSLLILQSDLNNNIEISDKILSIISSQATTLGRFEIIDRNLVSKILEEQKFQLSGMVNDENIIEIGNMASADEALILEIIDFNQNGVPKEEGEDEDEDDDENSTLFSWLVKTVVTEALDQIKAPDSLTLENNIHTEFRGSVKIIDLESGISRKSFSINASHTGGNRAQSLSKVLNEVSRQTRVRLKDCI